MAIIHVIGSSIFFYVLLLHFPITTHSISESEALLKLKQSFTNATSLDSWKPGTEPCDRNQKWAGVVCINGVVSSLRLRKLGLSGKIDVDSLISLSGLTSIGLVSNSFSGPIPDFRKIVLLRGLFLSKNQFSGEIPSDYFTSMVALKKVKLSGNMFSGRIPSSLFQLPNLIELLLDDNQFSGTIPPLGQSNLVWLDLSNNNLEGEIPAGMLKFSPNAFKGNPGLCGGNLSGTCDSSVESSDGPSKNSNARHQDKFLWFIIVCALLFMLTVAGIFILKRKQESNDDDDIMVDNSSPRISAPRISNAPPIVANKDQLVTREGLASSRRVTTGSASKKGSKRFAKVGVIVMINDEKGEFGLHDLMKAAAEVLGNGILGSSYKAIMQNGLTVVVKRIKEAAKIEREEFDDEMRKLGSLRHKNVLTPLAYHYRKDEKLLVYDYKPKGSLLLMLHGSGGVSREELNWAVRLKIIQGIARGLAYLHSELSSLDLPHGNLKSSNVLLTEEYEPLLADYALCTLISSTKAAEALTAYKCPEVLLDHHISPKCDVYFLGVIILEIITGKFPSQYLNNGENGVDMVQWVRSAIAEGREADLFDPDILKTKDCVGEIEQLLHIGAACTESNPEQRLDLEEAVRRIEEVSGSQDAKNIQVQLSSEGDSLREIA